MDNVYKVIKDYGEELDEFKSPLSRDWETVLFKAIDKLHKLGRGGGPNTRPLVLSLSSIISSGRFDEDLINKGIREVRELSGRNRELTDELSEVQKFLFAVKISLGKKQQR